MEGSLAAAWETKILDHIVGKTDIGTLPTAYIALFTTAATHEDGTGVVEPTGVGNYARKLTAPTDWNAAASGSISNGEDITFVECATTNWGTINGFGLYTALTGGVMIAHGELTTPKPISIGDTAKFAGGTPGDLVITLD